MSKIFFLIPLIWLLGCGNDDEGPTVSEVITTQPWKVTNFNVQASTLGVQIPQATIEPFLDDILAQVPLNGTVTFNSDNTFTIDNQGAIISGTWSLSADESEITLVLTATSETFTFTIVEITANAFTLQFSITEDVDLQGNTVPVTLDIIAFLIPA